MFAYLLHLTGDYNLSLDLVQESFTRYLSSYGSSEQSCSLLFAIARNAAMDVVRKRKEDRLQPGHEAAHFGDPERSLAEKQSVGRIVRAMQKLKKADRELLAMVATRKFSYKQISELLDTSEASVKVRVHRARLRLKDILNKGE